MHAALDSYSSQPFGAIPSLSSARRADATAKQASALFGAAECASLALDDAYITDDAVPADRSSLAYRTRTLEIDEAAAGGT